MKKLLVVLVLLSLLTAVGAYLYRMHPESLGLNTKPEEPPRFDTAAPVEGVLNETITATGVITPEDSIPVGSELSGRVVQLFHGRDDVVSEGEPLLKLDDRLTQKRLEQAHAAVATARTDVAAAAKGVEEAKSHQHAAEADRDYYAGLSTSGTSLKLMKNAVVEAARAVVETAQAKQGIAEGKLKEALAAEGLAQLNQDMTLVKVPFVDHKRLKDSQARLTEVGEVLQEADRTPHKFRILEPKVKLNQIVGPPASAELFVLSPVDPGEVELEAQIAESDLGKVSPGQDVYFTAVIDPRDEQDRQKVWSKLRTGMTTASLDVAYNTVGTPQKKVWLVPNSALGFPLDRYYQDPEVKEVPSPKEDNKKVVWVLDEKTHTGKPVVVTLTPHNGKIRDPKNPDALIADPYTEVEWPDDFTPGEDLKLIISAPPPPSRLPHMPSLFKS